MNQIKVLIVDDNFIARRGLRSFLESEKDIVIVGEASTGSEAVRIARETTSDVILMDIRMPDMDGIKATTSILSTKPDTKILMLTVVEDPVILISAIISGAKGYLVYGHFTPAGLKETIRTIAAGGSVILPSMPISLVKILQNGPNPVIEQEARENNLTPREKEIIKLIATCKGNREIAHILNIEEKTVKNHINNIYSKLEINNRQEAIFYMLKRVVQNDF